MPRIMNLNSPRLNMMSCYQIRGALYLYGLIVFVTSRHPYPVLLNATFWMQTGSNNSGPLLSPQIKPCDTKDLVIFREQTTTNKIYTCLYLFKAYFPNMEPKTTQIIVVKTTFSLVWDIILSLLRSRSTTVLTDPLPNLDFLTLWTAIARLMCKNSDGEQLRKRQRKVNIVLV